MAKYDNNLVVIGAGSAGLIASLIGGTIRAKTTLVERDKMGGDCLHTGCVPSKTLIASARLAHQMRHAGDFGIKATMPEIDFGKIMARVHDVIRQIQPKDSVERYSGLGVDCVAGDARLVDPHTVEVDGKRLTTRSIVLAMGAAPFVPPIPGLTPEHTLTSDNLWQLTELPESLLVVGGGPIGIELAQAFHRLGSKVTVVEMAPRILPLEDEDAASFLHEVLVAEDLDLRVGTRLLSFEGKEALVECNGEQSRIPFSHVLMAVGRRARTNDQNLEANGVELNPNGTVVVDSKLQTTRAGIYACGDIVGPYQFTHMASHQAWFAAVNALVRPFWSFDVDYSVVPWATFTDPEIARVGMSEAEATEKGIDVEVTRYPLEDADRFLAEGVSHGFIKLVNEAGGGKLLGACIVGHHAGDLISEYISAMKSGGGLPAINSTIHVYPTHMEAAKDASSRWRKANAPEHLLNLAENFLRFLR